MIPAFLAAAGSAYAKPRLSIAPHPLLATILVRTMRACAQEAPDNERAQRLEAVDGIERTWKSQAASVDTKERLVKTCETALGELAKSPCKQ